MENDRMTGVEFTPVELRSNMLDLKDAFEHSIFKALENVIKVLANQHGTTENDKIVLEAVSYQWVIKKMKAQLQEKYSILTDDLDRYLEVAGE